MSSITLPDVDRDEVRSTTPTDAIIDGFRAALRIHREQRAILKLSRLSPHMLEDIGFDPRIVRATRRDVWALFD